MEKRIKDLPQRSDKHAGGEADERRKEHCRNSASRDLKDGDTAPPGDRGACEKESQVQGSE